MDDNSTVRGIIKRSINTDLSGTGLTASQFLISIKPKIRNSI